MMSVPTWGVTRFTLIKITPIIVVIRIVKIPHGNNELLRYSTGVLSIPAFGKLFLSESKKLLKTFIKS